MPQKGSYRALSILLGTKTPTRGWILARCLRCQPQGSYAILNNFKGLLAVGVMNAESMDLLEFRAKHEVWMRSHTDFHFQPIMSGNLTDLSLKNELTNAVHSHCHSLLLPGEKMTAVCAQVTFLSPFERHENGVLRITNHRLLFSPAPLDRLKFTYVNLLGQTKADMQIHLHCIRRLEKFGHRHHLGDYGLLIECKDFQLCRLLLKRVGNFPRQKIFALIQSVAFARSLGWDPSSGFAFAKAHAVQLTLPPLKSHTEWDPVEYFADMNLAPTNTSWRTSNANQHYAISPTYPQILMVPAQMLDQQLIDVAQYRKRGRFPVLSWLHPRHQTSLCRSSQPKCGLGNRGNSMDELILRLICHSTGTVLPLIILDARPLRNALANKTFEGGGSEDVRRYGAMCRLEYMNIENIHVMRESWRSLFALCNSMLPRSEMTGVDELRWEESLKRTKWMSHIQSYLHAAIRATELLDTGECHVLIHCTDGWDRTPTLVSLVKVMGDARVRTLTGFMRMLEVDWIGFGHRFSLRVGHEVESAHHRQCSPTFLQFLDCVYQLMNQYPTCFEFNSLFLIELLDHVYSCRFHTFLWNSERERRHHSGTWAATISIWDHFMLQHHQHPHHSSSSPSLSTSKEVHPPSFVNTLYTTPFAGKLIPSLSLSKLKFWFRLYCRWDPQMRHFFSLEQQRESLLVSRFLEMVHPPMSVVDFKTSSEDADLSSLVLSGIVSPANKSNSLQQEEATMELVGDDLT